MVSLRARAGLEIGLVYAALEGALWTLGRTRSWFGIAAAVLILLFTLTGKRSWTALGLDVRRIVCGWWVAPAGVGVAALILLAGHFASTFHGLAGRPLAWSALGYPIWALVQEFIAQGYFFVRFEAVLGGSRAVLATAALFAIAHIPNPVLVPVTLGGGLVLSELFRRYRTIYLLAVAQIVVALSLAAAVPNHAVRDMRVGAGYVRYSRTHALR
ncbi:MAG: CPBP family glutamic-type intramembrane protease [Terriglobales bacterium]